MAEWQEATADIFCTSVRDGTHDSPKPTSRGQKLITSRHIIGGRIDLEAAYLISDSDFEAINRRSRVDQWDVLITMIGTVGEPCLVRLPPDFAIKNIGLFKSKGELEGKWLYYYLRDNSTQQLIRELSAGTTQSYIALGTLRNLIIRFPKNRREMEAIVSVLGALDDKIELNRRMNETLEATARAIFKDWFVDFGPTRAKMEGRAPYLAPDIWSLFPDRLDDEGKPEGWSVGSLSDIAILNSESWTRANYPDCVDYVDLSNTKWGTIESITQFTSDAAPSRAQRILRPGDTIVGTVRPGNGSYAFVSADGLTGSTGFAVLRPTRDIYREAVYLAATSKDNIDRLAHLADGGAYPAVRPELVAATELVSASGGVLAAFSSTTGGLIDRAEANKRENRTLAATRDFLLPKLMSGQVRVNDAEKLVGEAT